MLLTPSPSPLPDVPFWPQDAVGWAGLLTFGLLIFAAIVSYRSRLATQMEELSHRWDEAPLVQSRRMVTKYTAEELRDWVQFYFETADLDESSERLFILLRMPDFFEDIGVMVRRKAETWEPAVHYPAKVSGREGF